MRLGIDFGTTRTVVALCDDGNHPIVQFEDAEGELQDGYPSVIAFNGDQVRYGWEALALVSSPGWSVMPSFKRLLGTGRIGPVTVGAHTHALFSIVEGFLASLVQALRASTNLPPALRADPLLEAIIATPAHADSSQRFVTLEAFRSAGFQVVGMMNEPSAAGVEYASRYRSTFNTRRERVLVYDLGGGTFDASVVDMAGGRHDVVASAGLPRLGGDDFDALLVEMALSEHGAAVSALSEAGRVRLQVHCREQKEGLHANTRRLIVELGAVLEEADRQACGVDADAAVIIRTDDYYQRCRPLIEQTLDSMQPLLSDGSDPLDGIAGVYVVGGGSALPMVGRVLKEAFGRRVHRSLNPTAATAVGLARAFAENSSFTVQDQLSRSFGVFREASGGESVSFDLLFDASQPLPESGATIELTRRYRPVHNVGRFRYVECSGLDGEGSPSGDVSPIREIFFPYDPALRASEADLSAVCIGQLSGHRPLIEERYTIDEMGIVRFEIADTESGFSLQQVFSRALSS
jgi:molecular chaperone DnaK (HSP70)